jgi:DNA (cytosine-5)-methyltransferase 1
MNYYNEWDKPTAAWLQELINQGMIPNGHIDTRSIADVQPGDLDGYTQCHFFAGVAGWCLALQLAGWPPDRPVWTGSCPCQPFSAAGKRKGQDDERHVWPEFFRLIRECGPNAVFGEQVEGAVGHGWLDGVFADLEGEGYTCGAAVLGAHSAGAPHMRQRLYWVADGAGQRNKRIGGECCGEAQKTARSWRHKDWQLDELVAGGSDGCVADSTRLTATGRAGGVSDTECVRCECQSVRPCATTQHSMDAQEESFLTTSAHGSGFRGLSNTNERAVIRGGECEFGATRQQVAQQGNGSHPSNHPDHRNEVGSYWSEFDILNFLDGKARRIEPGTFPLVDGLPRGVVPSCDISESYAQATSEARVMRLKGYGNAIVPAVAAEFISAFMECSE